MTNRPLLQGEFRNPSPDVTPIKDESEMAPVHQVYVHRL